MLFSELLLCINFFVTIMDLAFWCLNKCFGSVFYVESVLYFMIQHCSGIFMAAVAPNIALVLQKEREIIRNSIKLSCLHYYMGR